jgi:hypothetical protein
MRVRYDIDGTANKNEVECVGIALETRAILQGPVQPRKRIEVITRGRHFRPQLANVNHYFFQILSRLLGLLCAT